MAYTDADILAIIAKARASGLSLDQLVSPGAGESSTPGQIAAAKAFWDRVAVLSIDADATAKATAKSARLANRLAVGYGNVNTSNGNGDHPLK